MSVFGKDQDDFAMFNPLQKQDTTEKEPDLVLLERNSREDYSSSYGTLPIDSRDKSNTAATNGSSEKTVRELSQYQSKIFSSRVRTNSFYKREKREKRWKPRNIFRRFAGIPFAALYGLALYLMLRFIFIDAPVEGLAGGSNSSNTTNRTGNVLTGKAVVLPGVNYTEAHTPYVPKVHFNWGANRSDIVYGSIGFGAAIGTISIFSRGTRCSMLLMLPCLITGRSRTVLFTFIATFLVDGPVTGIVHNFNEISENTACVYDAVANMAKTSLEKLNGVYQGMLDLVAKWIAGGGTKPKQEERTITPTTNLTFPRVEALNKQIKWMKKGVKDFEKAMSYLRKILTVLSILFMTYDAISYLRSYYSDNTFDNKYITRNVKHVWKSKKYLDVLPLRNWEKSDGYKSSSVYRMKKREFRALLRRTFSTVLFTVIAILLILADYLLAKVLLAMKDEEDVVISSAGYESELDKAVKDILNYFHHTTRLCGVNPMQTPVDSYILISVFLFVAIMSCFFEVLTSRLRSRMCNIFYTDRAHERADYLHFRITAGRINRRTQLMLTIKSNMDKRNRLIRFSPWARLKSCLWKRCCCNREEKTLICPGCEWKVKKADSVNVRFTLGTKIVRQRICHDCNQDFRPLSFNRNSQNLASKDSDGNNQYTNKAFEDEEIYMSV